MLSKRAKEMHSEIVKQKLRSCKAILFDFGGTLDSDGEHWLDRFYELYREAGLNIRHDRIKEAFYRADDMCSSDEAINYLGLKDLMKHHVRLQFTVLNIENPEIEKWIVERFCVESEYYLKRNSLLLERLKRCYKLGVVSNFYGNVEVLCKEAGLAPYLDTILDSTQVGLSKPDLAFFKTALGRLGVLPEEAIFVGDSYERDILPARRLGMKAVWVNNKESNPEALEDTVDATLKSLLELERLVL